MERLIRIKVLFGSMKKNNIKNIFYTIYLGIGKKFCIFRIERYRNAPPSFHGQNEHRFHNHIYARSSQKEWRPGDLTGFFIDSNNNNDKQREK